MVLVMLFVGGGATQEDVEEEVVHAGGVAVNSIESNESFVGTATERILILAYCT
jgi:hypothetical protein